MIERIAEIDEELKSLHGKIDTFIERVLSSSATTSTQEPTTANAIAALQEMHDEETQLADDVAKRREAALVLRQRIRLALIELRRTKEPTPEVQETFTRIFVSTSMARSFAPAANNSVASSSSIAGASSRPASDNDATSSSSSTSSTAAWELKSEDFQIDRKSKLGSGAFGDVFRGTCRGKVVAIKELTAAFDEQLLSAFRSEVNVLASLRHGNIVLFMGAWYAHRYTH